MQGWYVQDEAGQSMPAALPLRLRVGLHTIEDHRQPALVEWAIQCSPFPEHGGLADPTEGYHHLQAH